jgi:NAD-dependent dihydropyrimidine dehydrogenase PreA subunit
MREVLEKITDGKGTMQHYQFLKEMSQTIIDTALCGLGNTAPNPVLTTIKYFEDEYLAHIEDDDCPAHVCTPLVDFVVDESECIKCGRCYRVCPSDAIEWKKKEVAHINQNKCIKCKSCITECPVMAIT